MSLRDRFDAAREQNEKKFAQSKIIASDHGKPGFNWGCLVVCVVIAVIFILSSLFGK